MKGMERLRARSVCCADVVCQSKREEGRISEPARCRVLPLRGSDVTCNINMANITEFGRSRSTNSCKPTPRTYIARRPSNFLSTRCSGQGPAPTPAPTSFSADESADGESVEKNWLDAAWEVAVTVVGSVLVAAGAGCVAFACRRTRAMPMPMPSAFRRASAQSGKFGNSPAVEDGAAESKRGEGVVVQ